MNEYILVLITVPNKEVGEKIAEGIVKNRFISFIENPKVIDKIYLLDKMRGARFSVYKIVE